MSTGDAFGPEEPFQRGSARSAGAPPGEASAALAKALSSARARWPGVVVADEDFAFHLAKSTAPAPLSVDALATLFTSDLFLACGCLLGDPTALALFDQHHLRSLPRALGRIVGDRGVVAEIIADLRVHLLVGNVERVDDVAKISQYRGRGPLKGWVEVTAKRLALARRHAHAPAGDADALVDLALVHDPELQVLRARYVRDFREIVRQTTRQALQRLSGEERNLLRWIFVENISLRRVAQIRGVNVSTVSRDFARVRGRILSEVRLALARGAGLPIAEIDSLMDALLSDISISIGKGLATA